MSIVRTTLLALDALLSVSVGLSLFFFPHFIGDYIFKRETDGVHWHLIRCVGGQILASAAFFRLRYRDAETRTAFYLVRMLGFTLMVMITMNARSQFPQHFNQTFAQYFIYFCFSVIGIYTVALLAGKWKIGGSVYRDQYIGNALYQLDSFASVAIGMAWIAFPNWLLHRQVNVEMDESHAICGRFMGALFVASHFVSTQALHWKEFSDRSLAAETRALVCFFILTAQIWSQYSYKRDWSRGHWVGITLFSIWAVLSFSYRLYLNFATPPPSKSKQN